jgi:hypothetical protein
MKWSNVALVLAVQLGMVAQLSAITVSITTPSPVTTGKTGLTASVPAQTGWTYAWTISNGAITAGAKTHAITYTAGSIGTTSLACTLTSPKNVPANLSKDVSVIAAPVATITADALAVAGATGLAASVPDQAGCTYVWTLAGATVTTGAGTHAITYRAGAAGTATLKCVVKNTAGTSATGTQVVKVVATKATILAATPVTTGATGLVAQVPNTAGATYAWTVTNGTLTSASNISSITYTAGLVGTATLGCKVTASGVDTNGSKTITIIAAPDATITASTPVTAGKAGLTASVAAQQGCTFKWTLAGSTITAGAASRAITYTAGAAGPATLTCTVKNAAGASDSKSKPISIIAAPIATITAAGPVTAGTDNHSASVPSQANCTYNWVLTNATISSGSGTSAINYTAGVKGTATLKCTVTNAAATAITGTRTINVLAAPVATITTTSPVTTGTTGLTASVPAQAGCTYAWTLTGSGTITSVTNKNVLTYTAGAMGTVSLACKVTNVSGAALTGHKDISVIAAPNATIIADTMVIVGEENEASVPDQPGCRFLWTITNGIIVSGNGTHTITYKALVAGLLSLKVTVKNAAGTAVSMVTTVTAMTKSVVAITTPAVVTTGVTYPASTGTFTGATYHWTISNGTLLTGQGTKSITYKAGSVGSTDVICTVTLNGVGSDGTKNVTIVAAPIVPVITAPTTVTPGLQNCIATVPAQTGCNFAWTITNGTITAGAASTTLTFTAGTSGTTGLSCVATNGAGTSSAAGTASCTITGGNNYNYLAAYNSGPQGGQLGLVNHWIREAWEGDTPITTNMSAPAPGRSGAQAEEVTFGASNGWNAIGFAHRIDWNNVFPLFLNQFRTVEFDIYFVSGSTGNDNLVFILEDGGHADEPAITSLIPGWSSMTNAQKFGTWHHVVVDLTKIHAKTDQYPDFDRVLLFNNADGSTSRPHFYLADVKLGWVQDATLPVITFGSATLNSTYDQLALAYTTDEPTIHKVDYGTTASYGTTITGGTSDGDYALAHAITLPNLTPGTTVYYRITATDHQFLNTATPNASTNTGQYVIPALPTNPPVISGLKTNHVDSCSAVLAWNTDRPCTATLSYQKSGGPLMTRTLSTLSSSSTFTLDLLESSTTYTVTVVATDAFNNHSSPASIQVTTDSSSSANVTITINPASTHTISPWIYGMNINGFDPAILPRLTMNRAGGNRWTAYNWENNASNAGSDWLYESDDYLGGGNTPAEAVRSFVADNQTNNRASLVTFQLQGYVAADKNGPVATPFPNLSRFRALVFKKSTVSSSPFTATPSTSDANVYMDEFLWALKNKMGSDIYDSTSAHPTFVSLDNEPELWGGTHAEIQNGLIAPETFIQKSVNLTKALKDQASNVITFGPVHYGFNGIVNWQNSSGFTSDYWFTDKYLDEMKAASNTYGKRLLDVYDIHWYSEATSSDGTRVGSLTSANLTDDQVQAIVQSPRSFWDPTYTERSWIADYLGEPVRILPRLQEKIDAHWQGTKLAVTEYDNGGDNHIAGAIAQADTLGIYGAQNVFAATLWPMGDCPYILAGFRAFRGFDGAVADFGDVSVNAVSSDVSKIAAYISEDSGTPGRVVMVLINRATAAQEVALNGHPLVGTAYVYRITADSAKSQADASQVIKPMLVGQAPVNGSSWTILLPPLSVTTVEVK